MHKTEQNTWQDCQTLFAMFSNTAYKAVLMWHIVDITFTYQFLLSLTSFELLNIAWSIIMNSLLYHKMMHISAFEIHKYLGQFASFLLH